MGSIKMAAQPPPYGATAPPQQGYPPPPQQGYPPPPQQGFAPPQQGYVPPPQQGYVPPPQQPQQPVVVQVQHNSAPPVARTRFEKFPMAMTCPHCQANITTATTTRSGGCAWLTGLGILFLSGGFCCPCAFIPCCIDDFKDFIYSCPSCNRELGSFQRL